MKIVFFILGFLLLYLSCLPCGDSVECNDQTEMKITAADNQHEHQSEACTPFCTCSCCAVSAFYSFYKFPASKIVFLSEKFLLLNEDADTEVFSSIWQPPQLS
jgi:hypothetical protein